MDLSLAGLTGPSAVAASAVLTSLDPLLALEGLKQRLEQTKIKYHAAARVERVSPLGIAVNPEGEALGLLQLTVLSANNLPPVKRINNTADPYVEMLLLSPPASSSSEAETDPSVSNPPSASSSYSSS